MILIHKLILYGLLGFVGISLLLPGLMELLKLEPGHSGFVAISVDAKNQFRALYAMMAGVGMLALIACINLDQARLLVIGLGVIMTLTAAARVYSMLTDGVAGFSIQLYLAIEVVLAAVFLLWPPPA